MGILLTGEGVTATPEAGSGAGSMLAMVLIYGLFFLAIWFVLFRPQKKEQKKKAALINSVEVGDSILTTSGFYGIVIDVTDEDVIVEFGNNKNCRIPMKKGAIEQVEKPESE